VIEAGGGVKFGDGSVQDTAVHRKVVTYNLASGAVSADIDLPADDLPIQVMGNCATPSVRGVGQATLIKVTGSFVEWVGINSESNGTLAHGFSSTPDTKIVQLDYVGSAWIVVGSSGDTIRIKNFAAPGDNPNTRAGTVTLIW
jgi:hypothetical protein